MPPEPPEDQNITLVHLGADILAILEIAEVDSYISMQVSIQLTWLVVRSVNSSPFVFHL